MTSPMGLVYGRDLTWMLRHTEKQISNCSYQEKNSTGNTTTPDLCGYRYLLF